jgi:hypothetical protein
MKPSSCVPRGSRSEVRSLGIQCRLGGKNLRAAGRAVVDAIGQTPHLGVVALAGMGAQGVGQVDYVPQGLERGAEQRQAAGVAAGEAGSYRDELT